MAISLIKLNMVFLVFNFNRERSRRDSLPECVLQTGNPKTSIIYKKSHSISQGAFFIICDREGIRTPNLLIRSEVLYPVKLRNHSKFLKLESKDNKLSLTC